jgi:hypothetical protein
MTIHVHFKTKQLGWAEYYLLLCILHNTVVLLRDLLTCWPVSKLAVLLFSLAKRINYSLTFWHRSFTFNSNKSPTWCYSFPVYYLDVCLQLNMFRAFSRPLSGVQWLQLQPLVLPSYRGDSCAVFVVGPAGRTDHEHSTIITTIRR